MRQPRRPNPRNARQTEARSPGRGAGRGGIAFLLVLVTTATVAGAFWMAEGRQILMPGPLSSAHVAIDDCSSCHTNSGKNKLSWVHGLAATDALSDSKACLACHKMPNTAFNPHGTPAAELEARSKRLVKLAEQTFPPLNAIAQNAAFPMRRMVANGLNCAACHQEHQGMNFDLKRVSDQQCRGCHMVQFDSFDGNHPKFTNYPFKRRSRIIYDHGSHFDKHFPEVAKKNPARRPPATCAACHNSNKDERVMAVTPFDNTCAGCHLDQITGKERVSGPKGIAFLSLPGLDLETLSQKNAAIGEWPEDSEANFSPFMKVMISRKARGRELIRAVSGLDLQDLSKANDQQIKAVAELAWEIKTLIYELITEKASTVLADLKVGDLGTLSPELIGELTASIPRDVIVSAHQQWLPNLGVEMANRSGNRQPSPSTSQPAPATTSTGTPPAAPPVNSPAQQPSDVAAPASNEPSTNPPLGQQAPTAGQAENVGQAEAAQPPNNQPQADTAAGRVVRRKPRACVVSVFGECLVYQGGEPPPAAGGANFLGAKVETSTEGAQPVVGVGTLPAQKSVAPVKPVRLAQTSGQSPGANKAKDGLLFPSEQELRQLGPRAAEIGNPGKAVGPIPSAAPLKSAPTNAPSANAAPQNPATANAAPAANAPAPSTKVESDIAPEVWAEYGGWYQQDYAIFYRPKGHKDRFIYSWLVLTSTQARQGGNQVAIDLFDSLTGKDAQGSCTKCHSVDANRSSKRTVNFFPTRAETKRGRFTSFIHKPHFGIMDDRGCLTCHKMQSAPNYLQSYKQGDPQQFQSNFSSVEKELCQSCHAADKSRQDCLLCHKYHVTGVVTPMINTEIPKRK